MYTCMAVGVGKEGRECHFTIKDISSGVVVLTLVRAGGCICGKEH